MHSPWGDYIFYCFMGLNAEFLCFWRVTVQWDTNHRDCADLRGGGSLFAADCDAYGPWACKKQSWEAAYTLYFYLQWSDKKADPHTAQHVNPRCKVISALERLQSFCTTLKGKEVFLLKCMVGVKMLPKCEMLSSTNTE